MATRKRNYTRERLAESGARKKARAARGRARYAKIKSGTAKVGDGKVVHHTKPITRGGTKSKTVVQSKRASNREGGKLQPKSGKARGGRR
jgi:hypothetical protein